MATVKPGNVVVADFPGVTGVKRRPAVVVSTADYHTARPDALLGAITTNLATATASTDHRLRDWRSAGLRQPSAFRTFLVTLPQKEILAVIGHLSDADWAAVQNCLRRAIAI